MRLFARKALWVVVLMASSSPIAHADVVGKIAGTVKDQTNAVIPGAMVEAANTATGVKQTATTDEQGNYSFPDLPVGQYEINVTAEGFNASKTPGLTINIGTALTVDVTLRISGQNQTVSVSENAVRVETSDTQLGEVIESKQVTDIP